MGEVDFGTRQDDQVDAPVLRAALGGIVAGDRVKLSVSGGRKSFGGNCFQIEKDSRDAGGAGRRELPVGVEFRVVDGNVVGMALDAQIVRRAAER